MRLVAITSCLVAAVAACQGPTGSADYRDSHPLNVERSTIALVVPLAANGASLSDEDRGRVNRFAGDFLRRARSPLTISAPSIDSGTGAAALRQALLAQGIRSESIALRAGEGSNSTIVMSFEAYTVAVPECGDWSGSAGFNPSNLPHTDFGCSYQRNMGLMLSDPGDLVAPRTAGSRDAQSSDRAINLYRDGKPTQSEASADKGGTVSSVGNK